MPPWGCPSLLLSLRLVLSFSLFLFLVLLLFCSAATLISSVTLLYFFSFFIDLCFISYSAHSLPPLFLAHLCFSLFLSFSPSFSPSQVLLLLLISSSRLPLILFSLFSSLFPLLFSFSTVSLLFLLFFFSLSFFDVPFLLSYLRPLCFPSSMFGSSSGFYSQRTQAFFW